jgi:hypothetical protein
VIEVGLRRVNCDDRDAIHVDDRVAVAEELLEVDVADVAGIVVPGHDDERIRPDPLQVGLRLGVLLLEAVGREIAGADDDLRSQLVDLHDRPLHQVRHEVGRPAVQVGDVCDSKHPCLPS